MSYKIIPLETILNKLHHSSDIYKKYDLTHLTSDEILRIARAHRGIRKILHLSAKEELEARGYRRSSKRIWSLKK